MNGEIPVFTRCCCCLPLRYGLLVWGYFKLIADALIITSLSCSTVLAIMDLRVSKSDDDVLSQLYQNLILPVITLAIFIADFMMTIVFIVGGHKKNVELIKLFFYISIAMWIFSLLMSVLSVVLQIENLYISIYFCRRFMVTFSFCFITLVIQTYFIILLRSEIIKLKSSGEFRFVNNAAEAECTMEYNDGLVAEEKETRDVWSKGTCETGEEAKE